MQESHNCPQTFDTYFPYSNDGSTPLWVAASEGHLEIVRALGERTGRRGAKAANGEGLTPRMAAARNGHADVEKFLAQLESRRQADILFLKHVSRILRQSSIPVCGSWKSQASSLWAKQHRA